MILSFKANIEQDKGKGMVTIKQNTSDEFENYSDYQEALNAKNSENNIVYFGSQIDDVFRKAHDDVKEKGENSEYLGWVLCPERKDRNEKWTYEGNQAFFAAHLEKNHTFICTTNIQTNLSKDTLIDEFLWLKDNGYTFETKTHDIFGFVNITATPPKSTPPSYFIKDYRVDQYDNDKEIKKIKEEVFKKIKDESKTQMQSKIESLTDEEKKKKAEYQSKNTYYQYVFHSTPPTNSIKHSATQLQVQPPVQAVPPPEPAAPIQNQLPNIKFSYSGGLPSHTYYLAGGFNGWLGKTGTTIKPAGGAHDQWRMQYNVDTATWDCAVYLAPGDTGQHYQYLRCRIKEAYKSREV